MRTKAELDAMSHQELKDYEQKFTCSVDLQRMAI